MENQKIDQEFAYKILKEDLFAYHKINTETDANLFAALESAANWDAWALKYLNTSPEIQQLLEVLQSVNDTYTTKNFDKIRLYLKENPEYNDKFYITFDDFYLETFSDMLHHLTNSLFDLQSMDEIIHFVQCIKKRRSELEKTWFPDGHNELTFVVKVSFDTEDGALVHQVFMWKTADIDEEMEFNENDEDGDGDDDQDLDDIEDFDPKQEPFSIDQFISIWANRTYNKDVALVILKTLSYGDTLFSMFELDEDKIKNKTY